MTQQDIIMFCQQDWDLKLGTNARSLAREFGQQNRVLYVNMPLDIKNGLTGFRQPAVRKRLRVLLGQEAALEQVAPAIWVLTPATLALSLNWLPVGGVFNALNRLNARGLAGCIRRACHQLGFSNPYLLQDGIIFQGTELKDLLRPRQFLYYLRDYFIKVPYFQRHGPTVEAALMRQADAVLTNSAYLTEYARQHNPRSYNTGQGCDLALYQPHVQHPEPADVAPIPPPRIGYTGFLTSLRLDIQLLEHLARERPAWQLVLVGPEDADFSQSALHGLPNVHFLGNKLPAQLAAYVQAFDVCINPQLVNDATIGNYPLKIDEYLLMGRPVVATETLAMEMFRPYTHLATCPADWLPLLEQALSSHSAAQQAAGIAFAQSHTWAAVVAKMYAAIAEVSRTATEGTSG